MKRQAVRPTSSDVAQRAGVSRATVSYVLNDTPDQTISESTRRAVLRAARDLGYRPNAGARSLRSGRSDIVLFPMPGLRFANVWGNALDAMALALREQRLTLVTDFTNYDTLDEQLDAWLRLNPAAVIDVVLRRDDPALDALRKAGIRTITTGTANGSASARPIDALTDRAREVQVARAIDTGRTNIVFAMPAAARKAHFGRGRQLGMHRAIKSANAKLSIEDVELDRASARDAVRQWKKRRPRPTAICTFNDELAIVLLQVMTEEGVGVPGDVSVIGLDNIPLAAAVSPALTTVDASAETLGRAIVGATRELLDTPAITSTFEMPEYFLIERESG